MDVDILKPDMGYLSVMERPSAGLSNPTTKGHTPATTPSSSRRTLSPPASRGSSPALAVTAYSEPLSEGEDDDDVEYLPAKDEGKRTGLSGEDLQAALAYREQMLRERREAEEGNQARNERGKRNEKEPEDPTLTEERESQNQGEETNGEQHHYRPQHKRYESTTLTKKFGNKALSIDPLAPSQAFDETLKTKLQGAQVQRDDRHLHFQEEQPCSSSSAQLTRSSNSPNHSRHGRRHDRTGEDEEEDRPADEVEEEAALGISKVGYTDDRILERNIRAPAGKKISIPVRIEPKVYFAAERTFLVCSLIPTSDSTWLIICRNGSPMPFSSVQLLLPFSTSFLLKIPVDSSAQLSLLSLRSSPSLTLRAFSSIDRTKCVNTMRKDCITINMGQQYFVGYYF